MEAPSLFALSQARPFSLDAFSSLLASEEGPQPAAKEGDKPQTTAQENAEPQTAAPISCASRCARIRRDFEAASFWAIDAAPAGERRMREEIGRDGKQGEEGSTDSEKGKQSVASPPPPVEGSGGTLTAPGEAARLTGAGDQESTGPLAREVLCPLFRLALKHSCNLTLVGKRLCGADLLLRPLAVVHSPARAEASADGAKRRKKDSGAESALDARLWRLLGAPDGKAGGAGAQGEAENGQDGGDGPSSNGEEKEEAKQSAPAPPPRAGPLYLRHITLNLPASSPLALDACRCAAAEPAADGEKGNGGDATANAHEVKMPGRSSSGSSSKSSSLPWGPEFSYGLLLVRLEALPPEVREAVFRASTPFGRLLEENAVHRQVCVDEKLHIHIAKSFFEVEGGALAAAAAEEEEAPAAAGNEGGGCGRMELPPGCTCVPLSPPGPHKAGEKPQEVMCTFGRWMLVVCNDQPTARGLEIVNAALLLRAAALARQVAPKSDSGSKSSNTQSAEHTSPEASGSPPSGQRLQPAEQAALEHLGRVCLCSAQECPVHRQWLDVPAAWGPPDGFSSLSARNEQPLVKGENVGDEASAAKGTPCFNCCSLLCVEGFAAVSSSA